jgi:hypothetical protein
VEHLLHSRVNATACIFTEEGAQDQIEVQSFNGKDDRVEQDFLAVHPRAIVPPQKYKPKSGGNRQHQKVPQLRRDDAKECGEEVDGERVSN